MKTGFFFISCFLLIACSGKNNVPEKIIPPEKMENIIWDVIRAQDLSGEMARRDSTINEIAETKILVQKVFEIHNITSAVFDQSYQWYTSHPEMMRTVFDSLNAQNQRESDLRSKHEKPFRKDLIKK